MNIPGEAIESALEAFWANEDEPYMTAMKWALEAAAPHMQQEPSAASVWDEAANVLYMGNVINQDHLKAMWERNPYRSQA